eukprot:TRINITY_DN1512_c0_g1_i1.p1 TRINITY_DN1512_c0_g1~~TRINITY_DN1512_c0_g1_i1.p1  ORF type:complete len:167 (-),score=20.02 TRINITY_DN1512_c0_g1_i1:211-711(-)
MNGNEIRNLGKDNILEKLQSKGLKILISKAIFNDLQRLNTESIVPSRVQKLSTSCDVESYKAEVLFDYDAVEETELNVKKHDIVVVHTKITGGWTLVTMGHKKGWIPSNYLSKLPEGSDQEEMSSPHGSKSKLQTRSLFEPVPSRNEGQRNTFLTIIEKGNKITST